MPIASARLSPLRPMPRLRRTLVALAVVGTGVHASEVPYHEVQRVMDRHCYECHNPDRAESDLDLQSLEGAAAFREQPALLENMEWAVSEHEMPPRDATPMMADTDREKLVTWMRSELERLANIAPNDPGPVVMPRLTAREYGNIIRDLTGIDFDGTRHLPKDSGAGEGFTNVGAGQMVTTGHMEQFLLAAEAVLAHLRASPEAGLLWYGERLGPVLTPATFRADRNQEWLRWHHQQERDLSGSDLKRVENATGLRMGAYLEAAWRFHHRDALGLDQTSLAEVALAYDVPLSPAVVTAYWRMLIDEPNDGATSYALNQFRQRWQQLPAPANGEVPADLRDRLKDLEVWSEYWAAGPSGYRRARILDHKYHSRQEQKQLATENRHPVVLDFSEAKDDYPVQEIIIAVTTARDGNQDDIVVWRAGEFLFGELQKGTGAKRYAQTRSENWRQHIDGFEDLIGESDVAWGHHPEGAAIPDDAIAVQAPARIRFTVPEGAVGMKLEAFIDPEVAPGASVQLYVTHDREDFDGPAAHDFTTWMPRNHVIGVHDSDAAKAASHAADRLGRMRPRFNQYRKSYYDFYAGFEAVPLRYLEDDTKGWQRRRQDEYGLQPYEPWERPATAIRAEADATERAYLQTLRQQVIDGAQMPHQDLVALLRGHDITGVPEGVIPTDDLLAPLPAEARQQAGNLIHAIDVQEAAWAERAREQLATFANRAWRRPAEAAELDQMLTLYRHTRATGASYDAALKQPLKLVLVSPHFIYRPQVTEVAGGGGAGEPYPLDDYALATRLAFVLWGSNPDSELMELAAGNELQDEAVLQQQVARMLDDPRAEGLAWQFAGEWFDFSDFLEHTDPDGELFQDYDDELRQAMLQEAVAFFDHLFTQDRPLSELITADYVFVNERLAEHYDIDGVDGDDFRKVAVPKGRRGGVLGLGAVLTKTSTPLRTSAVIRGTWLLEQVLGEHLPSPPPDVPQLSDGERNEKGETVAEQLARHREDAACLNCHLRIDPLGLAMEQFDPVGRWRDEDRAGEPIQAQGETADGVALDGITGLRSYLTSKEDQILAHFCRKFLGYCLGREVLPSDRPLLERMQEQLAANDYRFEPLMATVVTSHQFRFRRDGE